MDINVILWNEGCLTSLCLIYSTRLNLSTYLVFACHNVIDPYVSLRRNIHFYLIVLSISIFLSSEIRADREDNINAELKALGS